MCSGFLAFHLLSLASFLFAELFLLASGLAFVGLSLGSSVLFGPASPCLILDFICRGPLGSPWALIGFWTVFCLHFLVSFSLFCSLSVLLTLSTGVSKSIEDCFGFDLRGVSDRLLRRSRSPQGGKGPHSSSTVHSGNPCSDFVF